MMLDWIIENRIEVIGAILGFIYIYFEIKQSRWLWPVGILSALLYIYVFFVSKFYADMGLQFYYVFISVYGLLHWSRSQNQHQETLPVVGLKLGFFLKLLLASLFIYIGISFILVNYTDSPLPYWDSFTTSLSIVATWMLTRKILEQWIVWVIVDAVCVGLYLYKELYATTILYAVFTVLAVYGYFKWKKDMVKSEAIGSK